MHFLIIPTVNFVLCFPAIIAGKPVIDCLKVYFNQTKTYDTHLEFNFINIYKIIGANPEFIKFAGIAISLAICMGVLFYVWEKKIKWNNEKIITLALWFTVILTFTLPCMHERYLFVGEILSIIYYLCYKKNGYLVAIININAIITYSIYLFGTVELNLDFMAIIYLIALLSFSKKTIELLENNGKK